MGHERVLRLEQRADAAPAVRRRRRLGLGRGLAVGAGIVGRVHQRDHSRRDRRHVGARRTRLIRHRRRASAALSSPTSEERAAGFLLARALLLLRARRARLCLIRLPRSLPLPARWAKLLLIRLPCSLPLPVYGERVGVRGLLRLGLWRAPLTRRASRRSRCIRIGVLGAKNAGRRPAMLSPQAGRGSARRYSGPCTRCLDGGGH
jgi:hypothetical protein